MKKLADHFVAFLAGAICTALVTLFFLSDRESTASVVLSNETRTPLANLRVLNHETGGTLIVDLLAPGETETLRIYVRGEGGYVLSVELPEAGLLESERYVETGYTVTEHITPSGIVAEHDFY